jgi:hypothetical protein
VASVDVSPPDQGLAGLASGVLRERAVTHRFDVRKRDQTMVFEFQGLLDPAALAALRAAVEVARHSGASVRIRLREGTEVERSCVAELRALAPEVVADSAYLASWLAQGAKR